MRILLPSVLVLGGCPFACFVAGTSVATPDGSRAIDQLAVGDVVLAFDPETNKVIEARVSALHQRMAVRVGTLRAGEHILAGVTEEHPFYDPEARRWRPAVELASGDPVVRLEGDGTVPDTLSEVRWQDAAVEVFNLSVDGPETYFAAGFLVHNKSVSGDDLPCESADLGELQFTGYGEELRMLGTGAIQLEGPSCTVVPEVVSADRFEVTLAGQGDCPDLHTWEVHPTSSGSVTTAWVNWREAEGANPVRFSGVAVQVFELLPDGTPTDTPLDPALLTATNGWLRLNAPLVGLRSCDTGL